MARCGARDRSSARRTRAALDDAITYFVYANSHILVYPIPGRDGSVAPGERLINVVWYRNYLAGDDLDDLLLDANGIRREVSVPPGLLRAAARRRGAEPWPRRDCRAAIAEVVLCRRRPLRAGGARSRRAAHGVRPQPACSVTRHSSFVHTPPPVRPRPQRMRGRCATRWPPIPMILSPRWLRGNLGSSRWGEACRRGTRDIGRRSQVDGTWRAGDPDLIFGLHGPGE